MFYGFSCLYSLLLFGDNRFIGYTYSTLFEQLFKGLGSVFYWFGGHIWGTEQFYNSLSANPKYLSDFTSWANSQGLTGSVTNIFPILLALVTTIIVVWGLVRLIVKVCSLGKITY